MTQLIARIGAQDAALAEALAAGRRAHQPHRVVIEAQVAADGRISEAARRAGIPLLIDPMTHFLQGRQHPRDAWAQLPYGSCPPQTAADLQGPGRVAALVQLTVDQQVAHGASMIIPPYVQIDRSQDEWTAVQVQLWRATRRYLDRQGLHLPVLAVVACGWRQLERCAWPDGLSLLLRSLANDLGPAEVALAASKTDQGTRPSERVSSLVAVIEDVSALWPVIAWQQGILGEVAVAAGATGYESGLGWRETCDLRQQMRSRQTPSDGGSARPVYIAALGRSIPKRSVRLLLSHPRIAAGLTCLDQDCCPGGQHDLHGDPRAHALTARRRGLETLAATATASWRWNHLAQKAATGLALAERINTVAGKTDGVSRVSTGALEATLSLADHRRQTARGLAA